MTEEERKKYSLRVAALPQRNVKITVGPAQPKVTIAGVASPRPQPKVVVAQPKPRPQVVRVVDRSVPRPQVKVAPPPPVRRFTDLKQAAGKPSGFNQALQKGSDVSESFFDSLRGLVSGPLKAAKQFLGMPKALYDRQKAQEKTVAEIQEAQKEIDIYRARLGQALKEGNISRQEAVATLRELDKIQRDIQTSGTEGLKELGLDLTDKRSLGTRLLGGAKTLAIEEAKDLRALFDPAFAQKQGEQFGLTGSEASGAGLLFAVLAGTDFITGPKSGVLKSIGKDGIERIVKSSGDDLAQILGKLSDDIPVLKLLDDAEQADLLAKLDKATTKKAVEDAIKSAEKLVIKKLSPLYIDIRNVARNTKTADEFTAKLPDNLAILKQSSPESLEKLFQAAKGKADFTKQLDEAVKEVKKIDTGPKSQTATSLKEVIEQAAKEGKNPQDVVKEALANAEPSTLKKGTQAEGAIPTSAIDYTAIPQVSKTVFDNKTEIPQINRILENKDTVATGEKIADYYRTAKGEDWRVVKMSPDEYLDRAAKAMGQDSATWKTKPMGDVDKYAQDMAKGDKFPMPWVNEVAGSQEGRTRALAAKQLGIKEIDVAVATKPTPQVSKTGSDISNSTFQNLPKGVRDKIEKGQPLFPEDVSKINKALSKTGEAADQLALFEEMNRRGYTSIEDIASKELKSGPKSLGRGQQVMDKEFAKELKTLVTKDPSRISKVINRATGHDPKHYRPLIDVINSVRRKNPKLADKLEDFTFGSMVAKDAEAQRFISGLRKSFGETVKTHGTLGKPDRAILQQALDGQLGKTFQETTSLIAKNAENPTAVVAQLNEMRRMYDTALAEVNKQNLSVGKALINRRNDYFPHIKEILNDNLFTRPAKSADPDYVRRLGTSNKFSKERTGALKDIETDPYKVMDLYLDTSQAQIRSLVPSARLKILEDAVNSIGMKSTKDTTSWAKYFKKLNDDVTGSASVHNLILSLQGRYAAGTVLGSAGSATKNFIQPMLNAGITRFHALPALGDTVMSVIRSAKDGNLDNLLRVGDIESDYLRASLATLENSKIAKKSIPETIGDVWATSFYSTDMFGRRWLLDSFYRKALKDTPDPVEALKIAERQAETALPSRVPGTLVPATRGGSLSRMMALFQTEVISQTESIVEAVKPGGVFAKNKKAVAANIAGLAVAGNLFNRIYERAFPGQSPAPDPLAWIQDALENDDTKEPNSIAGGVLDFMSNLVGQLPFVGSVSGKGGRSPFNVPIADVTRKLAESGQNLASGEGSSLDVERILRELSPLVGRGGKPVFRAVEGVKSFMQGGKEVTEDGDTEQMFPIKQSPANLARVIAGGSYNTPEARDMFDGNEQPTTDLGKFLEEQKDDFDPLDSLNPELKSIVKTLREADGGFVENLKTALNSGKITQQQYDAIDRTRQVPTKADYNNFKAELPKGLNGDAQSILTEYKFANEDALDKEPPRPASVNLTNYFNKNFIKGLDFDFSVTPSNAVGNEVAKYQKVILEKTGQADRLIADKKLVRNVIDIQYGKRVDDINRLTSDELKNLYDGGKVSLGELTELFAREDLKYLLGATSTRKYVSLRKDLGVGFLGGVGGTSKSGSGSGSGKISVKPKLIKLGTTTQAPKAIGKARRVKLSTQFRPGAPQSQPKIRIER